MNLTDGLLPVHWYWLSNTLFVFVLGYAVLSTTWKLIAQEINSNVFFGAVVCLLVLWQINAGFGNGRDLHLLGVTSLYLMFGWQLAYIAIVLVVLANTIMGDSGWHSMGLNVLLMGGIPLLVTTIITKVIGRILPRHFFIYIFGSAFFAAGVSMLITVLVITGVLWFAGVYSWDMLQNFYLSVIPLMVFPEAFINGGAMTLLTNYRPHWVQSFQDEVYLHGK